MRATDPALFREAAIDLAGGIGGDVADHCGDLTIETVCDWAARICTPGKPFSEAGLSGRGIYVLQRTDSSQAVRMVYVGQSVRLQERVSQYGRGHFTSQAFRSGEALYGEPTISLLATCSEESGLVRLTQLEALAYHAARVAQRSLVLEVGNKHRWPVVPARAGVKILDELRAACLVAEYQSGVSMDRLADRYDVCASTVAKAIHQAGVDTRKTAGRFVGGLNDSERHQLAKRYEEVGSVVQVAAEFGIGQSTAWRYLKSQGIPTRSSAVVQGGADEAQRAKIVARYLTGESSRQLGREFGVSKRAVLGYVRKSGNETRGTGRPPARSSTRTGSQNTASDY